MKEVKFRQAIFHPVTRGFVRWHYWGLIDKEFVGIDTGWVSPTEAIKNSQRFTGLTDKTETRIFEGDILRAGELVYACSWDNMSNGWNIGSLNAGISEVIGNIYENETITGGDNETR